MNAILCGHALQKDMVVRIFETRLQSVVIDETQRPFRAHFRHTNGFKL